MVTQSKINIQRALPTSTLFRYPNVNDRCGSYLLISADGHADSGMIRGIYGKWIPNERPDYRIKLAEKLGQNVPYMSHDKTNES